MAARRLNEVDVTYSAIVLSILTPFMAFAQTYGPPAPPEGEPQVRIHRGTQLDQLNPKPGGGLGPDFLNDMKPLPPAEPSDEDQSACRQIHAQLGYDTRSTAKSCKSFERVNKTLNPDFKVCTDALRAIGGGNELTPFCFYLDRKQVTQRTLGCLTQTLNVVRNSFWFLEDHQGQRNSANEANLPYNMKQVLRECARPVQTPASKNAKVVGLTAYAANMGVQGLNEPMGGLSGLTRQGPNGIWSITDSKDHPVIHKFRFDVKENPTRVDMLYDGFTELKGAGDLDFEDLALLPNGELLASTEIASEGKRRLFAKAEAPSLLVKFNKSLDKQVALNVPEEIIPVISNKEVPCPPPPEYFGMDDKQAKAMKQQYIKDHKDSKCFDSVSKGIQFNKGLEGMSFDAASGSVFFAPEQPLAQDNRLGGANTYTKIYRGKLQGSRLEATEAFEYPMDLNQSNGISAMLALSHDDVLVLERGFDQMDRRATMKLFKVHLGVANGKPLEKTEFLDFDGLRSQVPAGFQNLDNFEGLALGPKLANGHRLLFVVSDDNFNSDQKTLMMTLEVGGLQ